MRTDGEKVLVNIADSCVAIMFFDAFVYFLAFKLLPNKTNKITM